MSDWREIHFAQAGDIPLQTRVRGGVTQSPRDQVDCKEYETDFSVWILNNDEPDYILHCIGFWRENARSFLVTYEKEDALSPFRCWLTIVRYVSLMDVTPGQSWSSTDCLIQSGVFDRCILFV
ncbi:uncharacterized protein LOC129588417 [Paramacrobiotus metropolitanus]|uniref:uncharacterized protein LOC129588417 n=1 Tax=Paramacrobiotus metropolitanus TaxID=2943436 RepID=UPI0024465993|nr:uncharacterized protein LOC129588417 [Paramacrobiotus metropolitanus]XP_055338591.1 uncharacterized protein LOC129588417 [Paramacrobiotus metropolitanus]